MNFLNRQRLIASGFIGEKMEHLGFTELGARVSRAWGVDGEERYEL